MPETTPAAVAEVGDARSVRLADGRVLRLAGLEPFSLLTDHAAADDALRDKLAALLAVGPARIAVLPGKADRYGRLPALLADGSGALVQASLARAGLAIAFSASGDLPCFAALLAAEDDARRAGRGFWAETRLPSARPGELRGRIGRFAIFEGVAVTVGNRPGRTYLNFGGRWSEDVTVAIGKRDRKAFGGEAALAAYAGRRLRLRGFLEENGGPLMVARSPLQIEMLAAPDAAEKSP